MDAPDVHELEEQIREVIARLSRIANAEMIPWTPLREAVGELELLALDFGLAAGFLLSGKRSDPGPFDRALLAADPLISARIAEERGVGQ